MSAWTLPTCTTCVGAAVNLRLPSLRWLHTDGISLVASSTHKRATFEVDHKGRRLTVRGRGGQRHCISSALTLQPCSRRANDTALMIDRLGLTELRLRTSTGWLTESETAAGGLQLARARKAPANGTCCTGPAVLSIFSGESTSQTCECARSEGSRATRVALTVPGPPLPWSPFDLPIFIINLRNRPESFDRLHRSLMRLGVARKSIHRVDATTAAELAHVAGSAFESFLRRPAVPTFRLDAASLASGTVAHALSRHKWRHPTAAEVATTISHVRALQAALGLAARPHTSGIESGVSDEAAEGGSPAFLVLEDDADVEGLSTCWARVGTYGTLRALADSLSMDPDKRDWSYVQLGSLSPIAYRRLPSSGAAGLLPRLAHSWGVCSTPITLATPSIRIRYTHAHAPHECIHSTYLHPPTSTRATHRRPRRCGTCVGREQHSQGSMTHVTSPSTSPRPMRHVAAMTTFRRVTARFLRRLLRRRRWGLRCS